MTQHDAGLASEAAFVGVALDTRETVKWSCMAHVAKYDDDQTEYAVRKSGLLAPQSQVFEELRLRPFEEAESTGNLLTTAGLTRLNNLLTGAGGQAATNTATRLGVGNGAGTAAVGDTDLSASAGSSNRYFQVMDATFPSVSSGVTTYKATYATGDANFAWNEYGIDIGTPTVSAGTTVAACLLNHKTSAGLGTKATGTWVLTVTITIS